MELGRTNTMLTPAHVSTLRPRERGVNSTFCKAVATPERDSSDGSGEVN